MSDFMTRNLRKRNSFIAFQKEILPKQVRLAQLACLIVLLASLYFLSQTFLFHNFVFVDKEHMILMYVPVSVLMIVLFIILTILRRQSERYFVLLRIFNYLTICILPYWGLLIMVVSVIEGRQTNFLVWMIGMLASSAAICILPQISVLNLTGVTVLTILCMNHYHFSFGQSGMLNLSIFAIICIWIAINHFYDGYSLFKVNEQLAEAVEEANIHKEEADQANKAKGDFLAHMSHEIRTPINAVLGMDELILRENEDSKIQEYAMSIKNAGNMLLALISDVLDFSKIDAGKMEIYPSSYHLASTLTDLINMVQIRAEAKGLKLVINVNPDTPAYLYGDEMRVKQIITNLLTNAVKYTDQGQITISVDYQRGSDREVKLIIEVKDTGIGIKKEDLKVLYDSFQRIDEARNHAIEGTGLGMNIYTHLLKMMNGSLDVNSIYGSGSSFTVHIPQQMEREETIGNYDRAYQHEVRSTGKYRSTFCAPEGKILIVDDNATNRILAKALLKSTQLQVDLAESGQEMLNKIQTEHYDLIFLDHRMPKMDGVEALRQMRNSLHQCQDTPVIALTANAVSGAKDFYLGEGFCDFLSKPIEPAKYEKMICQYLPPELVILNEVTERTDAKQKESDTDCAGQIIPEEGMKWCSKTETYQDILEAADLQLSTREKVLSTSLQEGDLRRFTAEMKATKNTARALGAVKLFELSFELEQLGKTYNQTEINNRMPDYRKEYQAVQSNVKKLISGLQKTDTVL